MRTHEAEYRFIADGGKVQGTDIGRVGRYEVSGDESYVRVEARNADGSTLWTQPLLARDRFKI